MSLFTVGLLVGPVAGPIAGSYLANAAGWRWNFWLLTIMVCLIQRESIEKTFSIDQILSQELI